MLLWSRAAAMRAILLFSHGSVLCGAERNVIELAARMEREGAAPIVEVGFLNYHAPDFETAVARCRDRGARAITIAPWFLVAGRFVVDDLPPHIERARRRFPDLELRVADAIRHHPLLADAILASAAAARPTAELRRLVREQTAGFCRDDPRCPLHGTADCPAAREPRPGSPSERAAEGDAP